MIRTRNLQDWNLTRYRCANRSSKKVKDAVAVRRVGERDVLGLEDGLGARLDALERARHGERELHLRVVDREVGLGHGALLDELVEVARVALEAHVLVVDHVREHLVEELGVVRHDERRDVLALRAREEVAEPLLLLDVQVVRRLVEEQEIGVQEHGARERELHLPAARQVADGLVDELLRELHLEELLADLLAAERREDRLLEAEVDRRRVRVGAVDVVVDEAGAELHELLGAGEAREGTRRDGAHERGLAAAVVAEEAVDAAAAHVEVRRVEQDLAAVGELELDVAEDLALACVCVCCFFLSLRRWRRGHTLTSPSTPSTRGPRPRIPARHRRDALNETQESAPSGMSSSTSRLGTRFSDSSMNFFVTAAHFSSSARMGAR